MTTQEAIDCLQELLNQLRNSSDRFIDGDAQPLIEAIEDHAIPALEEHMKIERIADKLVELGNPGPVLSKEELERALLVYEQRIFDTTGVKGDLI